MTAFHPESVYYGEERCPPGEFADESCVIVRAIPHPSGAARAPRFLCLCVIPIGGWLHLRKVKPTLWALVSGRTSLAFSLCCLALEQH